MTQGAAVLRALDSNALDRLVRRALGEAPVDVAEMPGGASTRRFFRVATPAQRAIAMFVPDAAPEEAGGGAPTGRWPFLEVQELLASRGVRVPRVLGEACDDGLLLVEDLGDDTLARKLARAPHERDALYRAAVRDLARAQTALADLPTGSVVQSRAFDEPLLRWELDHFREWGLDATGKGLAPEDRAAFDAIADRLARRIASWPRGFVHRDYQSTNLMVCAKAAGEAPELAWIDFQDALLGPEVYDLCALLNDSYQDLEPAFVEARTGDYAAARGLSAAERAELATRFDWMTVQRKLKDAGRFVFIDKVKKNPAFLRFFQPSLVKVRTSLARLRDHDPEMRALERLIAHV